MNLLTEQLPDAVEVCGRSWSIEPDFRLMVELENAVASAAGLAPETLEDLLWRFYLENQPLDAEAAVEGMLWFYRCGAEEKEGNGAPGQSRAYDFEQDAEALYTSFLQAFNIDLSTDTVHWWQFRRLMFGLPADTPFSQRLHYRTANTSGMGKEQKKHYSKMKNLYAIRQSSHSRETLAQRDARMLSYVERRFAEVNHGQNGEKG